MALTPAQQAALNRLLTFYDGLLPYDAQTNPGGFRNGGHRVNFDPALEDAAVVLQATGQQLADLQTAIAQGLAAYGSQTALTEAVTQAKIALAQAQAAVANGRVTSLTLYGLGGLSTSLNYPQGAVGEVLTGPDGEVGSYLKIGPAGSGYWQRYSPETVQSIAVRTANFFIDTGTESYPFAIMNQYRQLGLAICWDDLVAARGLRLPTDNEGRAILGKDEQGRVAAYFDPDGTTVMKGAKMPPLPDRFGERYRWQIGMDEKGRVPLACNDYGEISMVMEPEALDRTTARANLSPAVAVIDAKAPGTVFDVRTLNGKSNVIRYRGDITGPVLPYRALLNELPGTAHILDTGNPSTRLKNQLRGFLSYGQSWRVGALALLRSILISSGERYSAYGLAEILSGERVPAIEQGTGFNNSQITGLTGLSGERYMGTIGYQAAITFQKLCRAAGLHVGGVLEHGGPVGGATWDMLKPNGTQDTWAQYMAQIAIARKMAEVYGLQIYYEGVGWTHAAPFDNQPFNYYNQLAEMVAAHNGLNLNRDGSLLHFFTDQTAPISELSQAQAAILDQARFALDNSAYVHMIGPRYPYRFYDNIHHPAKEYAMIGELEGYVKFVVLGLRRSWDFFRPVSINYTGTTVAITTTRPYGMGDVAIDTKQIEAAPGMGIDIRVGGTKRDVTIQSVSGDTIVVTHSGAAAPSIQVSNAFYGPGNVVSGTHSGCWGNIKRKGPPSTIFPDQTIDPYLSVFSQQVNAS